MACNVVSWLVLVPRKYNALLRFTTRLWTAFLIQFQFHLLRIFISSFQNSSYQFMQCFFNIGVACTTDFKKKHLVLISDFLPPFLWHLSFVVQVTFVAQQHLHNMSTYMLLDISQPFQWKIKCFRICYIIYDHYSSLISEVICRKSAESFSARCIPQFQFDSLSIDFQIPHAKVNSYGCQNFVWRNTFCHSIW